jgi:hypothetical protein
MNAACRALAALGTDADRRALVAQLADPDPRLRRCASWGLAVTRDPAVILQLSDLSTRSADANAAELALITLDTIARNGGIPPQARAALTQSAAMNARDTARELAVRQRAAVLLGALGGAEAQDALVGLLRQPALDASLAHAVGQSLVGAPQCALALAAIVSDPHGGATNRFAAAEAIAFNLDSALAARETALELLGREAVETTDRRLRRRAVVALGVMARSPELETRIAPLLADPGRVPNW